ncbi:DUF7507 domain-containing protein [Leucobacter massiliensis]|nr:DUF11 domain-containing protein [Leucobacter massiliensis]
MRSTHHTADGPPRSARAKRGRSRRFAASLLAGLMLAGTIPAVGVTAATPARAETGYSSSSILGQGARPFFAYVKAGEYLWVKTDQETDYIKSQTGTEYSWSAGGRLYGPAAEDGVWQVYLATGDPDNPEGSWEIEARTGSSASTAVDGRVWTNRYYTRQTDGENPAQANLDFWMVNDTGYQYRVELRGFRGMNSVIQADAIGNMTEAGSCISAYESVEYRSGQEATMNCGDLYRIFFAQPAADLPATANMAGKTVYVAPPPLTKQGLEDESELSYVKAKPGSFAGTFTAKIPPRFEGNYVLQIDTNGNDSYGDPGDLSFPRSADGSGSYPFVWDGKDKSGKAVPVSGKKMNARILFSKVGEMHIIQRDVEGRDGIRVTRMNGDKPGDQTVSWDDSSLSKSNRSTVTAVLDAGDGVDSSGVVHGWDYDYSAGCHEMEDRCGAWGNNRSIDDWVVNAVDAKAEVQAFGGDPSIALEKTADRSSYSAAGEVVTYTFRVTNTGNLDLENVAVTETEFSGAGELSPVVCPATTLGAGAWMDCTATYTVQQADVERGTITNAALATGTPPGEDPVASRPDDVEIPAADRPVISLLKEIANPAAGSPGWSSSTSFEKDQTLEYRFTVKNTGNLTLTNIAVEEAAWNGSGSLFALACPADLVLPPGEATVCTATYTPASQEDVDRGTIDNTAVAHGDAVRHPDVTSDPSSAVAVAPHAPALQLVKTADKTEYTAPGEVITYTFTVTNVGNLTMRDIAVTETQFSGAGEMTPVACPADVVLAPAESTECTASYTVQQADLDRGEITNAATASGTPPDGPPVETPPSEVEVPGIQTPRLALDKTVDRDSYRVGDVLNYSFTVTNDGNVTVDEVSVEELDFTGAGEMSPVACPADVVLAPGESTVCTATYTATQADVDAGGIDNLAIAHGTDPGDTPVDSNEDPAEVPTVWESQLVLEKSIDQPTYQAGDTLTYTFTVTNTGTVTEYNVTVEEVSFNGSGTISEIACPAEETQALAPGASVSCTASYTPSLEDQGNLDALVNVAVATGNPGDPENPEVRSNEDDAQATPEPIPPVPSRQPLATTGGSGLAAPMLAGIALLTAGAATVLLVTRRRHAADTVRECADAKDFV